MELYFEFIGKWICILLVIVGLLIALYFLTAWIGNKIMNTYSAWSKIYEYFNNKTEYELYRNEEAYFQKQLETERKFIHEYYMSKAKTADKYFDIFTTDNPELISKVHMHKLVDNFYNRKKEDKHSIIPKKH